MLWRVKSMVHRIHYFNRRIEDTPQRFARLTGKYGTCRPLNVAEGAIMLVMKVRWS